MPANTTEFSVSSVLDMKLDMKLEVQAGNDNFLVGDDLILKKSDLHFLDEALEAKSNIGPLTRVMNTAQAGSALREFIANGIKTFASDEKESDKYPNIFEIGNIPQHVANNDNPPLFDVNNKFHPKFREVIAEMTETDKENLRTFIQSLFKKANDIICDHNNNLHPWVSEFLTADKLREAINRYGLDTVRLNVAHSIFLVIGSTVADLPEETPHLNVYRNIPLLINSINAIVKSTEIHCANISKNIPEQTPGFEPLSLEFLAYSQALLKTAKPLLIDMGSYCSGKFTELEPRLTFIDAAYAIRLSNPKLYALSMKLFLDKLSDHTNKFISEEDFADWMKEKSKLLFAIVNHHKAQDRQDLINIKTMEAKSCELMQLEELSTDDYRRFIVDIGHATSIVDKMHYLNKEIKLPYAKQILNSISSTYETKSDDSIIFHPNLHLIKSSQTLVEKMQNFEEKINNMPERSYAKLLLTQQAEQSIEKFKRKVDPQTLSNALDNIFEFANKLDTFENAILPITHEDDPQIMASNSYLFLNNYLREKLMHFYRLPQQQAITAADLNELKELTELANAFTTLRTAKTNNEVYADIANASKATYCASLELAQEILSRPPSQERTQELQLLTNTLRHCGNAVNNKDEPSLTALEKHAGEIAGKPDFKRKLLGAVCILGAAIALAIGALFFIPTAGTSGAVGLYSAYSLATVAGICFFGAGMQRGLSKKANTVATEVKKLNRAYSPISSPRSLPNSQSEPDLARPDPAVRRHSN